MAARPADVELSGGENAGDVARKTSLAPLRASSPSTAGRQTQLLLSKFVKQKRGAPLTTALELLIPLYPLILMIFVQQVRSLLL